MFDATHSDVRMAVERALGEDLGPGDVTTNLTVPELRPAHGSFLAKQAFIAAGVEILPLVYQLGGGAEVKLLAKSGDSVSKGAHLADVRGPARVLLSCERVALNFLQRLSGVATLANEHVRRLGNSKTRVLDTRKTTPGLRILEKMAVAAGGAVNHRKGLYDAVLIKNNHITAAGGVTNALAAVREFNGPVEIEVRTRAELDEALAAGAEHLLLDNLTPAEAAEWVDVINDRATVELSGNINIDNIASYADCGADFISCGAITHSAVAVDISFRLELES